MAAFTRYVDGTGPVWAGSLFPFLFITIALLRDLRRFAARGSDREDQGVHS